MFKKLLYLFVFLYLPFNSLIAQDDIRTIIMLAEQAKEEGETEKAISYYEELYEKTESEEHYSELINLYIEHSSFKEAEKLSKKRSKKYPERYELLIDRGYVAERQKNQKDSESFYRDAIKSIDKDIQSARIIANRFIQFNNFKWAEKAYLTSRKIAKNKQLFRFELANVYAHQGKTRLMVEEYLDILASNKSYIQTIQNIFQRVLHPDPNGIQMENLKNQLLTRIQKNPDIEVFSQLLIWLYIQDENFYGAFIQAKALDKRLGEKGKRLFSLGKLSLSNEDYSTSEQCFQYIIALGDNSPFYLKSKMKLLEVLKEKIVSDKNYSLDDLLKLKDNY